MRRQKTQTRDEEEEKEELVRKSGRNDGGGGGSTALEGEGNAHEEDDQNLKQVATRRA